MNVFVITNMGTPVSVQLSMMDAEHMIDDMQEFSKLGRESFKIFNLPMQPAHEWIINAMHRSAIVAMERGETPVVIPDMSDAFMFAVSEVGEAADALVFESDAWRRNNPQNKKGLDFEKEASQAIMMLALSIRSDFFVNILEQLKKWGFVDDKYEEPL